jgi:putative transposase
MPRTSRVIVPGVPYHVIQRGNRKQEVFFNDNDHLYYLRLLKEHCVIYDLKIWAYCLMGNHVHLIAVPQEQESFRAIAEIHRRYTYMINARQGWRGHLWEGRFKSAPMDARHLFAAVRYVERNPVRANIVRKAEDYRWSSARSHVHGIKNDLLEHNFLMDEITDWSAYLTAGDEEKDLDILRRKPHKMYQKEKGTP